MPVKNNTNKDNIEILFDLYDQLRDSTGSIYELSESVYNPVQKMILRKDKIKNRSSSGGCEDAMGMVQYVCVKGRINVTLNINRTSSEKYLEYMKGMVFEEILGEEVNCAIDADLAKGNVNGQITFRSIEEGLDKFAKLAGGKLVKAEDGSYSIVKK